ncbi:DNA mismatch repair protein MutS [Blattabacterium cuenoti]|uniref:DNA mismatch repair protein MutS n=1 Tax=Blattabacterium cuenoti TaxID=1653831 RepID=UPI00163B794B|nr:DNA mismatch repair protein MutS [Blattabacterium cuenoti]
MNNKNNKFLIKKNETPLMEQYNDIKYKYPDSILLFQVGDFYEIFGKDAIICSKVLNIVLTKRSKSHIQFAGFPCHSLSSFLPKLIQSGYRVAICDQLDIKKGKNIVKRGVTQLITPGVIIDENILNTKSNNFLASIFSNNQDVGLSFIDISTGEFFITEDTQVNILQYLEHFKPNEIIFQKTHKTLYQELLKNNYYTYPIENWMFDYSLSYEKLIHHFQTNSLKGFGIEKMKLGIIASGSILNYLYNNKYTQLHHITHIKKIQKENHMWIDDFTFKSLEIFHSQNKQGISLLDIIDQTLTPMGSRLLKHWISFPLKNIIDIQKRQNAVNELCLNKSLLDFIRLKLKNIYDIERMISKISIGKISPREILTLHKSIIYIIEIQKKILSYNINENNFLFKIISSLKNIEFISKNIVNLIQPDPPHNIDKGNVIANGVSKKLDNLRSTYLYHKQHLHELCKIEKLNTGISNLKIGYNNIFGFYFEIKSTKKHKIPSSWILKQTLINVKRYTTEKLKNFEINILNAEQKIHFIEKEIYYKIIKKMTADIKPLQANAKLISKLDVLCSFSKSALDNNYIKPNINHSFKLFIKQGRHPVIEQQFQSKIYYIPNDIILDKEKQQILIITGPNMSGKSAILRQTAIMILMAHIGSFIPAEQADIGLIDSLFSRVGASDNISLGESTFMVEMNETANILNNISQRSFIILDEIGRGTSTYDGISIAWAIIEFLHKNNFKPLTLFATHYHELNNMNNVLSRIKVFHIAVKKNRNNIIFMRKLISGGSEHSFGIYVAKISGMPVSIIVKANILLKQFIITKNLIQTTNNNFTYHINQKKCLLLLKKIIYCLHSIDIQNINNLTTDIAYFKIKQIINLFNNNLRE